MIQIVKLQEVRILSNWDCDSLTTTPQRPRIAASQCRIAYYKTVTTRKGVPGLFKAGTTRYCFSQNGRHCGINTSSISRHLKQSFGQWKTYECGESFTCFDGRVKCSLINQATRPLWAVSNLDDAITIKFALSTRVSLSEGCLFGWNATLVLRFV